MSESETRADKAGSEMGEAIIETVHLMYQNTTAIHYLRGLIIALQTERKSREKNEIPNNR